MDIQLQILMNFDIKFDKGWDYELKDNILIINLHNVMISNNNGYKDQNFKHLYAYLLNISRGQNPLKLAIPFL
jgi:hypothetical protein